MTSLRDTPASHVWRVIERARVLDADAELCTLVTDGRLEAAKRASVARVDVLEPGLWLPDSRPDGLGVLVLGGLLLRRAGWDDRYGAELLGQGDLLRPWEDGIEPFTTLAIRQEWRILARTRVARLDAEWASRMAPWPAVSGAMAGRALARSRRAIALMAISQVRRLDLRIWLLLWYLADRFGRVHADGVHLDLPLTHQTLAELAGARRPSFSAAMARLGRAGHVQQRGRSWVLVGGPPPLWIDE